jgi:type IV pilus assembly protein PilE
MRSPKGFTLVELLITLAIIGILTAIAFPSYQNHVRKGARAAAQSAMMEIANREAQYLLDARNYAVGPTAITDLKVTVTADVTNKYTITVTDSAGNPAPSTPPTFTVVATPIAGGSQASDGELKLTHTGAKFRAGNSGW